MTAVPEVSSHTVVRGYALALASGACAIAAAVLPGSWTLNFPTVTQLLNRVRIAWARERHNFADWWARVNNAYREELSWEKYYEEHAKRISQVPSFAAEALARRTSIHKRLMPRGNIPQTLYTLKELIFEYTKWDGVVRWSNVPRGYEMGGGEIPVFDRGPDVEPPPLIKRDVYYPRMDLPVYVPPPKIEASWTFQTPLRETKYLLAVAGVVLAAAALYYGRSREYSLRLVPARAYQSATVVASTAPATNDTYVRLVGMISATAAAPLALGPAVYEAATRRLGVPRPLPSGSADQPQYVTIDHRNYVEAPGRWCGAMQSRF